MSTKAAAAQFMVVIVAVALLAVSREAEAQNATCDPTPLTACTSTIAVGATPSTECCEAAQAQSPDCLCEYSKNPTYSQYVDSPNAMKITTTCNVTFQCS